MTNRDSLLMAVLLDPADDSPRLVLADWLDEHGGIVGDQEWAELIRKQIADGTFIEVNGSVSVPFWHQDNSGALQRIPAGFPTCPFVVRRGMVDEVRVTMGMFLGSPCSFVPDKGVCSLCGGRGYSGGLMPPLFARWPVRRVTVTDRWPGGLMWYKASEWEAEDDYAPYANLPDVVFDRLAVVGGVRVVIDDLGFSHVAPDYDDQDTILSDTLVSLGREAAGLPDLTGRKMPGVVV